MGFDMSPVGLKKLCREKRLFASLPELNEVLHLHHRGIVEIKGLEEYTGLKTLHLESNAILKIKGLDCLMNLRCLYLNQIKCLKGLSCCQCLRQLNLSGNMLCLEEDVAHLTKCKSLQSLDISRNKLDNEESLQIIQSLRLTLLKMSGNPIVSTIPYYRKLCLVQMPTLTYLDESPVSENERRLARAWTEGGNEEETSMRETIRKEEAHQREIHRQAFEAMIEEATAELAENERKQREAAERTQEERAEAAAREEQFRAEIAAREEAKRGQEIQEQRRAELAAMEEKRAAELVAMEEELAAELAAREKNLSEEWILERLECADKERKFKEELQERVLERMAQDKNVARPMLWGTKAYKSLWEIATNIEQS
ncbi:hypothetical protein SELMODRAFT_428032 [Selaginella moellendorffii]|uniref:U2A'/phosphoprotein 32 family A C-terminal domain-containing protein n=2 Tax=Selaginella moellendorffii TaxID=88036 RepID=D8T1H4_SELML|nr:hypothetical protein SELMODRAFT_428032 [Selaginella moellendorffii]